MMNKAEFWRKVAEVSNENRLDPNTVLSGPYAQKPAPIRKIIDENADLMRSWFREGGVDFDAWRAGAADIRIKPRQA